MKKAIIIIVLLFLIVTLVWVAVGAWALSQKRPEDNTKIYPPSEGNTELIPAYSIKYVWAEDNSTCTAEIIHSTTRQVLAKEVVVPIFCVEEEAKCDMTGKAVYVSEFSNKFFETQKVQVSLPVIPHLYTIDESLFQNDDNAFSNNIRCAMCEKEFVIETTHYDGEVTSDSKFLAIGFDDFRDSDFSLIIPMFRKYGAKATFNRIGWASDLSEEGKQKVLKVLSADCEVGDHTFYHKNYIYSDPLFNGQNPNSIEGNQTPFPSNEQMKNDVGGGKNVFGFDISASVSEVIGGYGCPIPNITSTWKDLTDDECQLLREHCSIYCNKTGLLQVFDELSNRYLGTSGNSFGSWSDDLQCYTGGIFSQCKTSSNHEIWERILEVTQLFYINNFGIMLTTWSFPGDYHSPFTFSYLSQSYYDADCTKLTNYSAKFESSLFSDNNNKQKNRSWNDCLADYGYDSTHDTIFPSRIDGTTPTMMRNQYYLNAYLSRINAIPYSTNRYVKYTQIATDYSEDFFDDNSGKSYGSQMYDANNTFYDFIEALRNNVSNGLIHSEVVDSADSFSERVFFEELLKFCEAENIILVTKAEAYDICFRKTLEDGNLVYNKALKNSAKDYFHDADSVPSNPDGYSGDCYVSTDENNTPTLVTNDNTQYLHYGIPYGNIHYSATIKGSGNVKLYAIKNGDSLSPDDNDLQLLKQLDFDNSSFQKVEDSFTVPNNSEKEFEQICQGLGDKIMGLKIVYSAGLEIKDISIIKQ